EYLNLLTSGYGTSTQTTNNLGVFILPDTYGYNSWSTYMWVPLTDAYGNLVAVNVPSGQQTLQLLSGGGENVIDFMFVPFSASGLPPVINNLNPAVNQVNTYINAANITFSVSSAGSTIATNKIQTLLNGTDISSSETFTGNNMNWSVSIPVPQNQILTMVIKATDANGASNSLTATFDTFSQTNFTIEAEDFDFNGGQYIDNPVPTGPNTGPEADSYFFYPANNPANLAVTNVDFVTLSVPGNQAYRPLDNVGTEPNVDFLRDKLIDNGVTNSDYDVGWWDKGAWLNYTRTIPTNNYYVYGRLAGGGAFSGTTLSLVTSGQGTTTQTTQVLGSFADPNAGGWADWRWVPMLNTNGQMAVVSLGGVETLRATSGGGLNANYYMFVSAPAAAAPVSLAASVSGSNIRFSFQTQNGFVYTVLYKDNLTDASWQTLTSIMGNGSVQTATDGMGQTHRFYKLSISPQ
ncbi:MAG: hypothetical protein ACREFE_15610, partial [Limisphaerales bacterium]